MLRDVQPVELGELAGIPPAMRYRIRAVRTWIDGMRELEGGAREQLLRVMADGAAWVGAEPGLAEIGYWMIDAKHGVEMRRQGCVWLTRFPSRETARRLSAIALDPSTPAPVREQATWTLGYRQVRDLHPSTMWPADAVQIADEALGKLADAATVAGKITSEQLPHALRHVQSDMTAAIFAKAPGLWGEALEAFATAPLARVLAVSIAEVPAQHRVRVLRLIAATLGEECVPLFVSRAADAPIDERLEMLFLAVAFGGEAHLGRLEDALRGMQLVDLLRKRAKWHLAHKGIVPTVRGLRVARTTALVPAAERVARCTQAADDLGALTKFARHAEAYLYTLWGWMVRGAGDPARARELVTAHPESHQLVRDLYLEDLARRGRVKLLTSAAQTLKAADVAALQLAIHGRPLAALELAATARLHTPELVAARALACYRAGRPELTPRILTEDLPPSEITDDTELSAFPGPHERWFIDHGPGSRGSVTAVLGGSSERNVVGASSMSAHGGVSAGVGASSGGALHATAIAALSGGIGAIAALAKPAPFDAEPDLPSIDALGAVVRRLGRGFAGATVYLAGEFKHLDRDAITKALEAAGARIVGGPFPGTDYYVHGDWCLVQTIAQLERQGARRIRRGELEGV